MHGDVQHRSTDDCAGPTWIDISSKLVEEFMANFMILAYAVISSFLNDYNAEHIYQRDNDVKPVFWYAQAGINLLNLKKLLSKEHSSVVAVLSL